jgi:hypothetical protein
MNTPKKTKAVLWIELTPGAVLNQAHSGYWYNEPEYKEGRVRGVWPRLTKARLATGLALLPKQTQLSDSVGRIVTGQGDGSDMDCLLQLSLFGRLIYG